ncbi:MAG: hypothetical protein LAP39_17770 [Acidobacteriia bacterium]|nr:hypothetical protein [Terriglobia bacterium]
MPKCSPKRRLAGSILPFYLLLALPAFAIEPPAIVTSVAVVGARVPVNLTTQAGQPYDDRRIARDVHELWASGPVDDVRVETVPATGGLAVRFLVTESPRLSLHEIRIEPSSFGLHPRLIEGTPVNALRAHEIALEARKQLNAEGYINARVDENLVPISSHTADLHLTVQPGKPVDVKEIEFRGDPDLQVGELRRALRSLRIRRVLGWRLFPAYSPEALESDLNRLRSLYISRGYFDASVRSDGAEIEGRAARIRIDIQSGPRYRTSDLTVTGTRPDTRHVPPETLCPCLLAAKRDAEREGILDFSARLNVRRLDRETATLTASVEQGTSYRVGRIEFTGNHHYTDSAVRRNFLLDEGQPLDRQMLRTSLARLNQTLQFEPLDENGLSLQPHPETGIADLFVHLTERKSRAWSISGPVGPASLAGPLAASLSSRLPPWGKGLLELSTYSVSISLIAFSHPLIPLLAASSGRFRPVLALQRPFTPGEGWKSGFMIAPQIGWRQAALAYAFTQIEQRLRPPALEPELPITVERPQGAATLICESPKLRFAAWRNSVVLAVRFLTAISSL